MSIVKRPQLESTWFLPAILSGMGLTFRKLITNLFNRNRMMTLNYPEQKFSYSPRFKGTHVLTVKKDGSLRCTACMLCATNCPAQCIKIVAAEHEDPTVEKYPVKYEIDILRCVFCGYCEEACPVDAVRMGPEWQTPALNGGRSASGQRVPFIYDIQHLAYRPNLRGGIQSRLDDSERQKAGI